jgi:hypothetical protein
VLHVSLDGRISELPSDKTLSIEDSVGSVHSDLVLGGITDQALGLVEGYVGRGSAVTLVVGDDLNAVVLPNSYAGVGGSEIDSDGFSGDGWKCKECMGVV